MLSRDQEHHPPQPQHIPTSYSTGMPHDVGQSGGRPASNQGHAYHPYSAAGQGARHPLSPSISMGSPMRNMTESKCILGGGNLEKSLSK